jgi:outer membrane beta-barrel protein
MKKKQLRLGFLFLVFLVGVIPEKSLAAESKKTDFDNLEVRVIRPRFVEKKGRFAIGTQVSTLLNQDFVDIILFSGHVQYHIFHSLAFELNGSYGIVLKTTDYNILSDNLYNVSVEKYSPNILLGGGFNWSPFYGKFQIFSESLLYFDTFFSIEGGVTGVELSYDHCPSGTKDIDLFPSQYFAPSGRVGIGQHFFFDKHHAVRWDFKYNFYIMDIGQLACRVEKETKETIVSNFILKLGYSFFL